ncbi:hypothetical protein SDC9_152393 [bioreactor metagenome]|uniref:Uncharacterized protein n=1 Tax=bioreactor metagenome TaxID=1076179 RepID=A0A645EXC3_9ZZZZ
MVRQLVAVQQQIGQLQILQPRDDGNGHVAVGHHAVHAPRAQNVWQRNGRGIVPKRAGDKHEVVLPLGAIAQNGFVETLLKEVLQRVAVHVKQHRNGLR